MRKFKLLKDLPGVKAGAIYKPEHNSTNGYITGANSRYASSPLSHILAYPDFWEEVKEPEVPARIEVRKFKEYGIGGGNYHIQTSGYIPAKKLTGLPVVIEAYINDDFQWSGETTGEKMKTTVLDEDYTYSMHPSGKRTRIEVEIDSGCRVDSDGSESRVIRFSSPVSSGELPAIQRAIEAVVNGDGVLWAVGVDYFKANMESETNDGKGVVIMKRDSEGKYLVAEYPSRPFSQEKFEADMLKAAEYFKNAPMICEECGEIGKHKESCSHFDSLPAGWPEYFRHKPKKQSKQGG